MTSPQFCCPPVDPDVIAYAWHDATCAEGARCRDREDHARRQPLVDSGALARFLEGLHELGDHHADEHTRPGGRDATVRRLRPAREGYGEFPTTVPVLR